MVAAAELEEKKQMIGEGTVALEAACNKIKDLRDQVRPGHGYILYIEFKKSSLKTTPGNLLLLHTYKCVVTKFRPSVLRNILPVLPNRVPLAF